MGTVILMGMNNLIQKNIYSSEKKKKRGIVIPYIMEYIFQKHSYYYFILFLYLKKKKTKN
jgi:hypothetical protein